MLSSCVTLVLFAPAISPLEAYIQRPEPAYSYRVVDTSGPRTQLEVTSQVWQGTTWKHNVLYQAGSKDMPTNTAILFITGDGPRPGDNIDLGLVAGATQLPVYMLFNVPNQPLWDMKEDDLIAHTFNKYLETKDPTWPLLFPMTKSAIKAMDAIQDFSAKAGHPVTKFIVTGASKRGWTTWLTAATRDKRVVGIAPLVFDNLNFTPQMSHQLEHWGAYSEQIEDYTRRGLQQKLATKDGQQLQKMVDPFEYRGNIKIPTMIVNGANDAYWAADATSYYWNELKQPKWLVTMPNAGHSLGNKVQAIESVSAMARAIAKGKSLPTNPTGTFDARKSEYTVRFEPQNVVGVKFWSAVSVTTDFRQRVYRAQSARLEPGAASAKFMPLQELMPSENVAVFAEVRYRIDGKEFSINTPTVVVKGSVAN